VLTTDARGDGTTVMSETLPTELGEASAVWDGANAYIFGGYANSYSSQILRYDPAAHTVTVMNGTLPTARVGTSAVWDGTYAYVFGGHNESWSPIDQIVRYDPATDAVQVVSAKLPTGRYGTSAVWSGTFAYIFGGSSAAGYLSQIVRYDPASDAVAVMGGTLPATRVGTSAVWSGASAYVFGGWAGSSYSNQVLHYDPTTDASTIMSATLPTGRTVTSAAWDGASAYVFGGYGGSSLDEIVRYDPGADAATLMSATLPTARYYTSAVWAGENAYIFGGVAGGENQIVRYNLSIPSAPRSLSAAAGPGAGEITLTWQAPAEPGASPVASYRVYRGLASGTETLVTSGGCSDLGNVLTCVDSDLGNDAVRYYQVTAVSAAGEGSQSREAAATTFDTPGAPRNLAASSNASEGQVTLSWSAPTSSGRTPITSYRVYRGALPRAEALLAQVGNVLTYTDTTCPPESLCFYEVSAVNLAGEGPPSNEVPAPAVALPRPTLQQNPDGSTTVYDDKNGNGRQDAGEALVTLPTSLVADWDGDGVPDSIEPTLCAWENSNFDSDGTCVGDDWSQPTVDGVLADVHRLLGI
jgi:N-acetylneuraminic acid mutarotase